MDHFDADFYCYFSYIRNDHWFKHKDFFNFIEQLVTDLLYKAFLDPELMQLATDFAWDQVNMDDPSDMEQQAFSIFMSRAKLPYTDKSWTLRKNVYKRMRNVVSKTYVPVYDIQNVEHTGTMEPSNGAILQLSMRLWPYHMSENTYGVSAQISDYGAKIYKPKKLTNLFKYFFGEDQARYIIEIQTQNLPIIEKTLGESNIYYENIGFTQENYFEIDGELKIITKDLFKINNQWYNNY